MRSGFVRTVADTRRNLKSDPRWFKNREIGQKFLPHVLPIGNFCSIRVENGGFATGLREIGS